MSGTLYVVGTPIGNLSDWSPRAVDTLGTVDFIAAEDTRVTLKLLNHFGIKKEMVSYYEHNRRERGEIITARIAAGEDCAIVTDAGMPAISDPGQDLVHLCHLQGIPVVSVPGPVAFATALAVSGMESGRFTFEGFLSVNKKSRRDHLEELPDMTAERLAERREDLNDAIEKVRERKHAVREHTARTYHRSLRILRAHPSAIARGFEEAMDALRKLDDRKSQRKPRQQARLFVCIYFAGSTRRMVPVKGSISDSSPV